MPPSTVAASKPELSCDRSPSSVPEPASSTGGESLNIWESAEVHWDLRDDGALLGDAGSEASGIASGRGESLDRRWSDDACVDSFASLFDGFEETGGVLLGEFPLENEFLSDKAHDANSAVSSRISWEVSSLISTGTGRALAV